MKPNEQKGKPEGVTRGAFLRRAGAAILAAALPGNAKAQLLSDRPDSDLDKRELAGKTPRINSETVFLDKLLNIDPKAPFNITREFSENGIARDLSEIIKRLTHGSERMITGETRDAFTKLYGSVDENSGIFSETFSFGSVNGGPQTLIQKNTEGNKINMLSGFVQIPNNPDFLVQFSYQDSGITVNPRISFSILKVKPDVKNSEVNIFDKIFKFIGDVRKERGDKGDLYGTETWWYLDFPYGAMSNAVYGLVQMDFYTDGKIESFITSEPAASFDPEIRKAFYPNVVEMFPDTTTLLYIDPADKTIPEKYQKAVDHELAKKVIAEIFANLKMYFLTGN